MGIMDILLLLMPLLIFGEGSISWEMENENFTLSSNCPKKCGDIKIEYPFGIGVGCYRTVEFNLICAYDSDPPRLLLGNGTVQVRNFNMEKGLVYIESPYVTLDVDTQSNSTLINLQNLPLSFNLPLVYFRRSRTSMNYNYLRVVGCSATASILDVAITGPLGSCSAICSTTNPATNEQRFTFDNGYCSLSLYDVNFNKELLEIQLTRLNEKENEHHVIINSTSNITALIIDQEYFDYDNLQMYMSHQNRTGMVASLAWYIKDNFTCKEAKNTNTYACLSNKSECYDVLSEDSIYLNETIGYNCRCSIDYIGNPYLPDGCRPDQNLTSSPVKDCQDKCGNVSIFFPFGLTKGCYRDEDFALTCNETSHPPTLMFENFYIVSKISLKEGQMEYNYPHYFDSFSYYSSYGHSHFTSRKFTMINNWVIAYQSCNDAAKDRTTFACIHEHSSCLDVNDTIDSQVIIGYRCKCSDGYDGNPYPHDGCKDINECNSPDTNICTGTCINKNGSYACICPLGTSGDPYGGACHPHKRNALLFGFILGASIGIGLLLFCVTLVIIGKKWKQRHQWKIRQRNFQENHGLLLQQLNSTSDHVEERTNIFSLAEIEKATNNFDEARVVGRGGHGIVFKGILSDQRVVAIKKSRTVKKSEIDQFINEVAVLSQINHRNVVKLFGCCLETEVPLLIYEFISNGTLSDHLHVPQGESKLSWDDRLRIATESAGALAYLHSAASISIFHRDVKSSNILLDDTFRAKVSDFGASRFIPLDQTHIVTAIHGTFGYLDPEYYQTSQLTEKSDVYSFGIILLELLSRKKPIYSTQNGLHENLAMNFFQAIRENMLFDLVEDRVLQEGTEQELLEISSLIKLCLSLKGVERPTMKEVEYKLQNIRKTRMKKRRVYIPEGNEEIDCLLTTSSHSSSEMVDQINQESSRNYSFEKEMMYSQSYAR